MAKFDPSRVAHQLESIEPATDPVGKVIGYYGKTSGVDAEGKPIEVFMSLEFIRDHFTTAPKQPPATAAVMANKAAKESKEAKPIEKK